MAQRGEAHQAEARPVGPGDVRRAAPEPRTASPARPAASVARGAVLAATGVAVATAGVVIGLRIANRGAEPEGQNWWLVAELILGVAYLPAGALLLARRDRRGLGPAFLVVGGTALLGAVATQYLGYVEARGHAAWPVVGSAATWAWLLGGAVLATLVLLGLLPVPWRSDRRVRLAAAVAIAGTAAAVADALTQPWPSVLGANPLEVAGGASAAVGRAGRITVGVVAGVAVGLLAARWVQRRRRSDDPLPAWLLAGGVVAVAAVVPAMFGIVREHVAGIDIVVPLLLIATVPLVVVGALIELVRVAPGGLERASHRFLEWVLLTAGIVVIYTALVAGLGRLVGGDGPTWFLVAATGVIALLVEPARRRIRLLVDRLVYGARDDTLGLVRQVVTHVGATGDGEELLPALAASLGREMCLDAVAIDVARAAPPGAGTSEPAAWDRAATFGDAALLDLRAGHRRELPLRYQDDTVGRLVVAWADAPSLRARDEATLEELAAPLALAVSWVRLADELRHSSRAVLSAREEERRRLRRDLHDGLGPSLTGISLGLRTAIRQLARTDANPTSIALLQRVADEVDGTVKEVKRIVRDLRPSALDELGLVGALAEYAHTLGGAVQLEVRLPRQDPGLPAAVEVAVYRIVTEALTNVVRHADAARCWLTVEARDVVDIDVVDDGVGLRPGAVAGIGLAAMRERAAALGGTVSVGPRAPHGTHLHVRLPAVLA